MWMDDNIKICKQICLVLVHCKVRANSQLFRTSSTPTPQPSQQEHQKQQHQGPHPQPPKEFNTATVCKIGQVRTLLDMLQCRTGTYDAGRYLSFLSWSLQETVQDIVARIHEVFSYLKTLPPPIGSAATGTVACSNLVIKELKTWMR